MNTADPPEPTDLTQAVLTARRGLRRDVGVLVEALGSAELLIPLAKPIEGARLGEVLELEDGAQLVPHLLAEEGGAQFCALFTRPELLEPAERELGWTTGDGPLEFCALPAGVALDMALQIIDGEQVLGLVLNPLHASELLLRRSEAASIAAGQPIPLVGYVQHIPRQPGEKTLVAEGADPPSAELVAAVEACVSELDGVSGYRLEQTFNAERDLEPHPTLTLSLSYEIDRSAAADRIFQAVGETLPPPGYLDLLFDTKAVKKSADS